MHRQARLQSCSSQPKLCMRVFSTAQCNPPWAACDGPLTIRQQQRTCPGPRYHINTTPPCPALLRFALNPLLQAQTGSMRDDVCKLLSTPCLLPYKLCPSAPKMLNSYSCHRARSNGSHWETYSVQLSLAPTSDLSPNPFLPPIPLTMTQMCSQPNPAALVTL